MKKPVQLIILFLLYLLTANAQRPVFYFEKISTQDGLSNNKVNCILQDKRGFMWIGTNDGLNRFDGNNFVVFRNKPGDNTSISGNSITDIVEDKNGVLWIATADGGLSRYDHHLPPALQFKQYKHLPGDTNSIPVNTVNALLEDANGFLWLATGGKAVIRLNKTTGHFDFLEKRWNRTILDLNMDKNGIIWAGRQGGGLLKIDPATFTYEEDKRYEDLYAKLPHVTITAVYTDTGNNTWYGSWDKVLYQYDHLQKKEIVITEPQNGFVNDELLSFAEDRQGYLWMGGKTKGLQLMDKRTGQFYNYINNPLQEGSVASNNIHCIYVDRSGKVWIGTDKGISATNPGRQQFVQTFLTPSAATKKPITVYDFYKDENKDLWIGTDAGIFLQPHNSNNIIPKPLSYKGNALAVTKFFKDSKGEFYIGTSYSLFRYNRFNNTISILPNTDKDQVMNKIIESRVVSIVEDTIDQHRVLIVSPYGHYLAYYDLDNQQWVSRLDTVKKILRNFNIRDNLVHKLYRSSNGQLWLANAKEGLGAWTKGIAPRIIFYQNNPLSNEGLSNNHVFDMVEGAKGNLWISTSGGGLNYFEVAAKKISHIPSTNNLLEGITTDRKNNVWMISNGNLHRYDPVVRSTTSFDLPDLEKSGGVSGYIYKDAEGKMYVAGNNYFIKFDPDSIKENTGQPEVYLTDFKIFNDSYSQLLAGKAIDLSYKQNYFTIVFAAPEFSSAAPVEYAYMLEGEDKDWVEAGTRNYASYSNLEGGDYTFRVKATNSAGNWTEKEKTIKISISSPIRKRWWFYLLCAVFVAGTVYTIYRYRINELLKRQAIRNKIAQDLHDNVGSTLSSISVYSQVAQIQNDSGTREELSELLGKISNTSTDMISELSDTVWAINPRNDNMEKILQRMDSFARPLLAARNILFTFYYDTQIGNTALEMEKRKNFYLIFKEAVTNAVKYSGASVLTATVTLQQQQLKLVITDNGTGFNPGKKTAAQSQSLSGNGLRNMQVRAKQMNGTMDINSEPGKGTTVVLKFPIP